MKILALVPIIGLLFCSACCGSGNRSCNNNQILQQQNSSDSTITMKVKAEIMSDTTISASARMVSVSTMDGVVTITGNVPTREDRDRIVKIAKGVRGVSRVDNQINVTNN